MVLRFWEVAGAVRLRLGELGTTFMGINVRCRSSHPMYIVIDGGEHFCCCCVCRVGVVNKH